MWNLPQPVNAAVLGASLFGLPSRLELPTWRTADRARAGARGASALGGRGDRAMSVLRVKPPQEAAGDRESEPHYGARVPSVRS
jgi:hypothetical protein